MTTHNRQIREAAPNDYSRWWQCFVAVFFVVFALSATPTKADTFGSDPNTTFDIEFVTIGNPGNAADTTGDPNSAGSVPYNYRIGKFEISEDMIDKANILGSLGLTHNTRGPNKPATSVNWFEAAKFVNWLNASTGGTAAYNFDPNGNFQLWDPNDAGYNPNNLYRNRLAKYVLPSVHEWYKAAYYDPASGVYYDYPTGSDTVPTPVASGTAAGTAVFDQSTATGPADITLTGGLSPYGTMGQGGNVWEWEETEFDLVNDSISTLRGIRGIRGGSWPNSLLSSSVRSLSVPSFGDNFIGFRVAGIPEPNTLVLAALSALFLFGRRERCVI